MFNSMDFVRFNPSADDVTDSIDRKDLNLISFGIFSSSD